MQTAGAQGITSLCRPRFADNHTRKCWSKWEGLSKLRVLSASSSRLCGERRGEGIPPCAANVSTLEETESPVLISLTANQKRPKNTKKSPHPNYLPAKPGEGTEHPTIDFATSLRRQLLSEVWLKTTTNFGHESISQCQDFQWMQRGSRRLLFHLHFATAAFVKMLARQTKCPRQT
jgi:hypothetical protein